MAVCITSEMSDNWLNTFNSLADSQLSPIRNWLIKKKFYMMTNKQMVGFFFKIDEKKFPKHKAMVWDILYLNEILDKI